MGRGKEAEEARQEEGEKPAGPGFIARLELRVIDAALAWLQHLRARLAGNSDGDDRHGKGKDRDQNKSAGGAAGVPADVGEPPARHRLRSFFIVLLLVGLAGAGAVAWSWRHFESRLAEHDEVVDRLQEELNAAAKEEKRATGLVDRFQRENGELRLQSREALAEAENLRGRVEGLTRQLDDAKRGLAELQAAKSRPVVPPPMARGGAPTPPQKTGRCAVGGAGSSEQIADCIERFNQR